MVEKEVPVKKVESQKVNSRYRLAKIDGKFYIIDYANARKFSTYFIALSSYKETWEAWEITKEQVKNEFHGFHPKKATGSPILFAIFALLGRKFLFPNIDDYTVIKATLPIKITLFLGILIVTGLSVCITQRLQSQKVFNSIKEVRIERKVTAPFWPIILFLFQILFAYCLLYSIFFNKEINIFITVIFLFATLLLTCLKFFDTPISTKYFIYTLKNNE